MAMRLYEKAIIITPKILRLISEIDEFKGRWASLGRLAPDRLSALQKIAAIESVASSTRIEGVKLSDSEIETFLASLDISSLGSRDEEEVASYAKLMNLIFDSFTELSPNENIIKQLHQVLLTYSAKDVRHCGDYKKLNNHIEAYDSDGKSLGIISHTASPLETPYRMEALCLWLRESLKDAAQHPLITIAVFVSEFLAIHPFQDGNGRLSRALTTLLLLRSGYDYVPFSSLERVIEQNKDRYYSALRKVQTEGADKSEELTSWITFFLSCMCKQKDALMIKLKDEKALMSLPKLSEQIVVALKEHGRLSLAGIVKLTAANRNTVKSHVFKLADTKQIRKEGRGKGTVYFL